MMLVACQHEEWRLPTLTGLGPAQTEGLEAFCNLPAGQNPLQNDVSRSEIWESRVTFGICIKQA